MERWGLTVYMQGASGERGRGASPPRPRGTKSCILSQLITLLYLYLRRSFPRTKGVGEEDYYFPTFTGSLGRVETARKRCKKLITEAPGGGMRQWGRRRLRREKRRPRKEDMIRQKLEFQNSGGTKARWRVVIGEEGRKDGGGS